MATITRPFMGSARSSEKAMSLHYESDIERFAPVLESDIDQPLAPNAQRHAFGPPGSSGGMGGPGRSGGPQGKGGPGGLGGPPGGPGGLGGPGRPSGSPGMGPLDGKYDPKSVSFWLIMISTFLSMFLVALDRTILATAIPRITDEFNSQDEIGWYASAYLLTSAASQLFFGRVYKFYDLKWTFLTCIFIFEAGSIVCGAAQGSTVFILGRAVAGVGSAGIFTGAMMIIIPMVPLQKRPMFQSMFGMVLGVSSVAGPLLGGVFSGKLSWRWCFWINLPIGAFAIGVVIFLLKIPRRPAQPVTVKEHILRLDPLGSLFLVPSVVSLLIALQWGGSRYEWNSWLVILLFALAGGLFIGFVIVQGLMPDTATVPFRIISQRSIFYASMYNFFLSGAMLLIVYFIPIWFQTVKRVDPFSSGVYTIPLVASIVISSVGGGIMTSKIGYYIPAMVAAPILMATGSGLMSTFNQDTSTGKWIAFQFLNGFGLGFGMQIANLAAQTVLPREDVSMGVSIMFFAQMLGGAIATSLGQNILSNTLVSRLAAIAELGTEGILESGATEILSFVEENFPESLNLVIAGYNYACTKIFFTSMVMGFATLSATFGMEMRSIKVRGPPGGGPPPGRRPSSKEKSQAIRLEDRSPIERSPVDESDLPTGPPNMQRHSAPAPAKGRDSQFSIPRKPVPSASQSSLNMSLDPPMSRYMREDPGSPIFPPMSAESVRSRRSSTGSNRLKKKSIIREQL